MSEKQYTYAVARIRAKELTLLNDAFLEQLISAKSVNEDMALLSEKGWKGRENSEKQDPLDVLSYEEEKTYRTVLEMVDDPHAFDVFLLKKDFHNLKAAVKETFAGKAFADIYVNGGTIEPEKIRDAVKEGDFTSLPESMSKAGKKALDTLLHYRDGQLCDIIIDRACLDEIKKASTKNKNALIRRYGELTVALADIKTAVRGAHAKKDLEFFTEALAECDTLDIKRLAEAASLTVDDIYDYLENTEYKDAVDSLKKSFFAFEKWCKDALMDSIRPEKAHPFTIGPLAAYILARESEIDSVRMILTGKENDLPDQMIRERISRTYV
ncbi:MAG: V-type ATP synthase subunit C [Lachnospiraceae bacterium]|uniref:V-type ATPase subunit n=1 Tax=Candidatus Weimeria bifida TaxID=2599074 RepID=A0A6N7IZ15_9FIRM|nr:V-type ATPase subunit [Candidatus Weimeria bifida]RRF97257.1 MAG: V-type ATP synthase subunit C [Lachnospiraceae bacterium]